MAGTNSNRTPSYPRRLAPFFGVGTLGFLVVAIVADHVDSGTFAVAAGLGLLASLMIVTLPWARLPAWAGAVPAVVCIASVAVMRDAVGGPTSGSGALVLLPVLWLGLYGNRLQLALVIPAVALAFFAPLVLVGAPTYPDTQWAVGLLYVGIALLLGTSVQRLIGQISSQAVEARRRELDISRAAALARRLSTGEGTRRDVCEAASEIGDAAFALLWEPDGDGRLVATAGAGVEVPHTVVDPARERAAILTAFRTGAPIFVPDVKEQEGLNSRLAQLAPDAVSILFQPVLRRGDPAGVLVVGWHERIDPEEHRIGVLVGLVSAEVGIAIERADLMTKLEELADTDELTGLPNRRAWNRELTVALSTAERRETPLCVALIDVDNFKELNDARGHQAGDRLLKSAAAAWRSALRPADVLARPGGDEFTLVLPDCDLERAEVVLERLRKATPAGRTCSIGVAQWDGGEPSERLVARVDEALYAAKQGGRDRVVASD